MSTCPRLLLSGIATRTLFLLFAQTAYPPPNLKTELFGGFSTTVMEPGYSGGKGLDRVRLNGWTTSVTTCQFFRRWGLAAEFSGHSRNNASLDVVSQY